MKRSAKHLLGFLTAMAILFAAAPAADAEISETRALPDGTQRTTYTIGPLNITSGQNRISNRAVLGSERPAVDGYITRIKPDLVNADGSIPSSSKVMFHHGVWINAARGQNFFATGEEKTILDLPDGYGYEYKKSDTWILNHMIHNLVTQPMTLYVTYEIDFIPKTAPQAAAIKPANPIWMDVERGIYPVFDVLRDTGKNGKFTYPQDANNPYGAAGAVNEFRAPRDGVLLNTTGHVHTGGLNTELFLRRQGASYAGPTCDLPPSYETQLGKYTMWIGNITAGQKKIVRFMKSKKVKRLRKIMRPARFKRMMKPKQKRLKKLKAAKQLKLRKQKEWQAKDKAGKDTYAGCRATQPTVNGNRVRLFESDAHYFEPAGPVSWDMAMRSTKDDWRVQVKAGDILELQTTYETEIASWYESMGINIVYWSAETNGRNPYSTKVDTQGELNHGHYEENNDHGGTTPVVGPDPTTQADGLYSAGPFKIGGYTYEAGGFNLPGANGRPPVVEKGKSFTFQMTAADMDKEIWHSLTSCKAPCNKSTGIAYPIADGEFQFDSGQMGNIGPPTVGRTTWSTPSDLPVGTHTYFCRVHPLMRGSFRIKPPSKSKSKPVAGQSS